MDDRRHLRGDGLAGPQPGRAGRHAAGGPTSGAGGANAAANGYWVHDEIGPKTYVAPDAEAPEGDIGGLLEGIEEQLALLPADETRRLHVTATGGRIVLFGQVPSVEARRRVGAHVVSAAGSIPVVNRLTVAEE
jgi:hypothetical protein